MIIIYLKKIDERENMKNLNLKDIKDDEFDSFLSR